MQLDHARTEPKRRIDIRRHHAFLRALRQRLVDADRVGGRPHAVFRRTRHRLAARSHREPHGPDAGRVGVLDRLSRTNRAITEVPGVCRRTWRVRRQGEELHRPASIAADNLDVLRERASEGILRRQRVVARNRVTEAGIVGADVLSRACGPVEVVDLVAEDDAILHRAADLVHAADKPLS